MGSHTRVPPWGKTISTRVVTSNVRHLTAGRGSNGSCCACASLGSATPAGRIALVFRNARLSMSVLRSIEALSHSADPVVPARGRADARNTRSRLLQERLRSWGEEARREGRAGRTAAAVDIAVGTPRSARARRLREADHHRERTRAA